MVLTEVRPFLPAHNLGVADAAAGEPEGPDGGALHRLLLLAGGGGGQGQQHLKREERFGDLIVSGLRAEVNQPGMKISAHSGTSCRSRPCRGRGGRGRGTCPPPPSA